MTHGDKCKSCNTTVLVVLAVIVIAIVLGYLYHRKTTSGDQTLNRESAPQERVMEREEGRDTSR